MKLSVIVPSQEGCLPPSLERVCAGCDDVEIVSVAGVSPVGRARNEGLRRATGDYIAWVDADDEVTDDWLSAIRGALTQSPAVLLFDAIAVGWPMKEMKPFGAPAGEVSVREVLTALYGNERLESHLWRFVIRRDLWDGLAFDEGVTSFEDWLLLPHVLRRASSVLYLPRALYRYVYRPESLIASVSVARQAAFVEAAIRRHAETPREYRAASAAGSVWAIYYAMETPEILPEYRAAPRLDPSVARRGRIFLLRHVVSAARSFRDTVRLLTAGAGFWALQRRAYERHFGRGKTA